MQNQKILENKINIKFKNKKLLSLSLVHKSFDLLNNNEKLEFLGDRVLGLVLSKKLFLLYLPNSIHLHSLHYLDICCLLNSLYCRLKRNNDSLELYIYRSF